MYDQRAGVQPEMVGMEMKLTKAIVYAAARDAGNRHARQHNRTVWNEDDYNACVAEFYRLCPTPEQWMELP